jgi:hypothetical protein
MSSDESHSSNFATQSSCELSFAEDVSCNSGGVVNMEKSVDLCEAYDTSVEALATEETYKYMKSTITEREQEQQTLSARLSGEASTDTWYVLDCIYLRFGHICDIKQTCDGHVKQNK